MLLDIIRVVPRRDFSLLLEFENGERRCFDMAPYMDQKPWVRLKAGNAFLGAFVDCGTVAWPGNIDIDPETLYELSVPASVDGVSSRPVARSRRPASADFCKGLKLQSERMSVAREAMPTISMFYGILIRMYVLDTRQHHLPHIHVEYAEAEAVFQIPDGELLEGELPGKQFKLVQAWIALHADELMADWTLAVSGATPYKIEPLR